MYNGEMPEALYGFLGFVVIAAALATVFFIWRSPTPTGADRREDPRVEAPPDCAVLSVDGAPYPLKNWSARGFLAEPYDGNLSVGEKCVVNIHVRQEPFDIAFAAEVVIVRKGAGELAGRFVFLPLDNKGQIDAYFAFFAQMR